ncbi:MAG TPA: hypothetical protein VFU72_03990, partial [Nitrolancea sp.]|nr:hypothetical protein [Nitrolancea sp.]
MADYYDLGAHSWPITTISPEAQRWFDRGLNWTYGFNHVEARRCFERAIEHDPNCAMAHWGVAYAAGPNYNRTWAMFEPAELRKTVARTFAASQRALAVCEHAAPGEQALISALAARYPQAEPVEDCAIWNDDYADAMRAVYRDYRDDLDVAALFAEALMNRTPWQLWDLPTGQPAEGASTLEARAVLERALEQDAARKHPGILHMYIHLMEMSPEPEVALRAADWLRELVPDAGHLRHMPTHIDVLCGNYHDVVVSNSAAIVADDKYLAREGAMNFYTLYRVHDFHFKVYGAMFLGQCETALRTADEVLGTIPRELLERTEPNMADWLEGFLGIRLHVLIRFGQWQAILDTPLPEDQELYCVTTALSHYARGVALAASGRVAEADAEQARFEAAAARVPESRMLFNNRCLDILEIARAMLAGELEYRRDNYEEAFAQLRHAVALDDGLLYDEPWGWMQPARHALGALLLEQGRVEEAAAVYRADLGLDGSLARACQHPENIWSLHGYHECLERLGEHEQAALVKQRLQLAAARADIPIHASCYCRMA